MDEKDEMFAAMSDFDLFEALEIGLREKHSSQSLLNGSNIPAEVRFFYYGAVVSEFLKTNGVLAINELGVDIDFYIEVLEALGASASYAVTYFQLALEIGSGAKGEMLEAEQNFFLGLETRDQEMARFVRRNRKLFGFYLEDRIPD